MFDHLKKQSNNSPSSLAILEKKLRYISTSIKDQFVKKYVLDYFLGKIKSLTPNLTKGKQWTIKHVASLRATKQIYNDSISLTKEQLQEFSILYLIINNLNFFKKNQSLLENINMITIEGSQVFSKIFNLISSNNELDINLLPIDKNFFQKINKFASVKHISNSIQKDENKLRQIFNEMKKDLQNLLIDIKISKLESKFSKDMDEITFNEIKELKKLQNNK